MQHISSMRGACGNISMRNKAFIWTSPSLEPNKGSVWRIFKVDALRKLALYIKQTDDK